MITHARDKEEERRKFHHMTNPDRTGLKDSDAGIPIRAGKTWIENCFKKSLGIKVIHRQFLRRFAHGSFCKVPWQHAINSRRQSHLQN